VYQVSTLHAPDQGFVLATYITIDVCVVGADGVAGMGRPNSGRSAYKLPTIFETFVNLGEIEAVFSFHHARWVTKLLYSCIRSCKTRSFVNCTLHWTLLGWTNGYVARMGEMRNAYKILVRKTERKRSIGRLSRRLEDNIRIDLREMGWEVVDWIHLARNRDQWWAVVNTVMSLHVP